MLECIAALQKKVNQGNSVCSQLQGSLSFFPFFSLWSDADFLLRDFQESKVKVTRVMYQNTSNIIKLSSSSNSPHILIIQRNCRDGPICSAMGV